MSTLGTKSGSHVLCPEIDKGEEGMDNQTFHVVYQMLRVLVSRSRVLPSFRRNFSASTQRNQGSQGQRQVSGPS